MVISVSVFTLKISWLSGRFGLLPLLTTTREYQSLRKYQNSKYDVYWMSIAFTLIKLKSWKLNHGKLGTTCVKQSGLSYFSKYCHRTCIASKYFQTIHQQTWKVWNKSLDHFYFKVDNFKQKGLLEQGSFSQIGGCHTGVVIHCAMFRSSIKSVASEFCKDLMCFQTHYSAGSYRTKSSKAISG